METTTDYVYFISVFVSGVLGFGMGLLVGYKRYTAIATDIELLKTDWAALKAKLAKKKAP